MKLAYLAVVGLFGAACGTEAGVHVESPSSEPAETAGYQTAQAAYLAGECDQAVQGFDLLLADPEWVDSAASILSDVAAARDQCRELLAADALVGSDPPAALTKYASLLSSWPGTALRDLVFMRTEALEVDPGATALASLDGTCPQLDEIVTTGLISAASETEMGLECAALYSGAGRTAEAFDAALRVLRGTGDPLVIERAVPLVLGGTEMCASFDEVRSLTALDQRPADLSNALQTCIYKASSDGDLAETARLQLAFLSALPDDPVAPAVAQGLLESAEACSLVGDAQADPVVMARPGFVADFTYHCAEVAEQAADLEAAIDRYQWSLDNAIDEEHATLARDGLARSLINRAEGVGAGELPEPVPAGGTGRGTTDVVVYNDSPEELRIVLSGPESRIEIIPASTTSETYSLIGPPMCRTDVPSLDLRLQPGEYRALVEATSGNVSPFSGDWTLTSGDAYQSCFFIVTSFV